MRAKHRKFEIACDDKQYFIYVPNACQDENLIVWSVLLANKVAALDGAPTDGETQEVLKLQRKFHENMDKTKECRCMLRSLEEVVDDLAANLVPFLDVMDGAKTDLNKALHKVSPPQKRNDLLSPTPQNKLTNMLKQRSHLLKTPARDVKNSAIDLLRTVQNQS